MKKLLGFGIIFVVGLGVWQLLRGIMDSSRFTRIFQDTGDLSRNWDENQVEQEIIRRAAEQNISITPDDIEVEIRIGNKDDVAADLVSKGGISALNKKVLMTVHYSYPVLFMRPTATIEGQKNHTIQATLPSAPIIPLDPQ